MENNNNKRSLFVPYFSVVVFLLLVFSAAYSYFVSTSTMNTANYEIGLPQTTTLVCAKTDCSTTVTPAMMLNTNVNASTAKRTSTCYLNCTCTGSQGAVCNYNVTLVETGVVYHPSPTLGTNKEFTVKVTSPSGCTAQNSSSTATQVNTMRDKVVSKCSLTVPASGTKSANVSAQFKWYNLDLNQDITSGQSFTYSISSKNITKIYRTYNNDVGRVDTSDGNNISVLNGNYYTSFDFSSSFDFYIKHVVEDDIIRSTYICYRYTEDSVSKEMCFPGGTSSTFGRARSDGQGATENNRRLWILREYFYAAGLSVGSQCQFTSTMSVCQTTDIFINLYQNGRVLFRTIDNSRYCEINTSGVAFCDANYGS